MFLQVVRANKIEHLYHIKQIFGEFLDEPESLWTGVGLKYDVSALGWLLAFVLFHLMFHSA